MECRAGEKPQQGGAAKGTAGSPCRGSAGGGARWLCAWWQIGEYLGAEEASEEVVPRVLGEDAVGWALQS